MATPEHFFGSLDVNGAACQHEPQQDFTVPYDLPHRANGYSGSGLWYFPTEPIWSPEPRLCGILATECTADKVVSGFRIETVIKFLQDSEGWLLS
jgi:hypothetical protein